MFGEFDNLYSFMVVTFKMPEYNTKLLKAVGQKQMLLKVDAGH